MRQEEAEVERRIAVVTGLEIDQPESTGHEQDVLRTEIGQHERVPSRPGCLHQVRQRGRQRAG